MPMYLITYRPSQFHFKVRISVATSFLSKYSSFYHFYFNFVRFIYLFYFIKFLVRVFLSYFGTISAFFQVFGFTLLSNMSYGLCFSCTFCLICYEHNSHSYLLYSCLPRTSFFNFSCTTLQQ